MKKRRLGTFIKISYKKYLYIGDKNWNNNYSKFKKKLMIN